MEYNIKKACDAQYAYCEAQELPHFAPPDGFCYYCGKNIYSPWRRQNGRAYGISVEEASERLITNCPHCARSFCE